MVQGRAVYPGSREPGTALWVVHPAAGLPHRCQHAAHGEEQGRRTPLGSGRLPGAGQEAPAGFPDLVFQKERKNRGKTGKRGKSGNAERWDSGRAETPLINLEVTFLARKPDS